MQIAATEVKVLRPFDIGHLFIVNSYDTYKSNNFISEVQIA
jgi:hypothetical protein